MKSLPSANTKSTHALRIILSPRGDFGSLGHLPDYYCKKDVLTENLKVPDLPLSGMIFFFVAFHANILLVIVVFPLLLHDVSLI